MIGAVAASISRPSTTGSRATSTAPSCSTEDPGSHGLLAVTSSRPTSARRSRRTRSPRAPRSSSRSPAAAASARSPPRGARNWGIGVDKDQSNDAKRVLTSGVKASTSASSTSSRPRRTASSRAARTSRSRSTNGGMSVGKSTPPSRGVHREDQRASAKIISGRTRSHRSDRLRARITSIESPQWRRRPSSRCAGSRSASRASSPTTTSTSTPSRRGARAAGRERRGQVDPDEHALRPVQARRGRDPRAAASGSTFHSARTRSRAGSGWCTSTSC